MVLEKTLESPLDSKEIKEINPEYSLEGLMLKLELQYSLILYFQFYHLKNEDNNSYLLSSYRPESYCRSHVQ